MNFVTNSVRFDNAARALKRGVLGSLSATPLVAAILASGATTAHAQQTAQAQAAQAPSVEEIVVTGTRVVRDGFQAPTPVSVVNVEELQNTATSNLADSINELPSLSGSSTPQSSVVNTTSGLSAVNALSMRGQIGRAHV